MNTAFNRMDEEKEVVDVSAMMDLYVQKVSLETTQLVVSLSMEVKVMHTVDGNPEEGWEVVINSAQKIVEFINLFYKRSQQKISLLALMVIDKLQGAHNKLLEAAREKHPESTKGILLTSAKLYQKSAKFFTYALIAERSGQSVLTALYNRAGQFLALEATLQHHVFEYPDVDDHFKSIRTMMAKSVELSGEGNNRSSRIYEIVAQYHQALAAIAIDNFDDNAQQLPMLMFQSTGLLRVYLLFDSQLRAIEQYVSRGMLWQAEVLVTDLHNFTGLLNPNIVIDVDLEDVFAPTNLLVESAVRTTIDHDEFIIQNSNILPTSKIIQLLQMGRMYLFVYVQLWQVGTLIELLTNKFVRSKSNYFCFVFFTGPSILSGTYSAEPGKYVCQWNAHYIVLSKTVEARSSTSLES